MEVTQFTYFQQVGGIDCDPVSVELTYGLERLAMYVQGVENVYDLDWDGAGTRAARATATSSCRPSGSSRRYQFRARHTDRLSTHFADAEANARHLLRAGGQAWRCRPTTNA